MAWFPTTTQTDDTTQKIEARSSAGGEKQVKIQPRRRRASGGRALVYTVRVRCLVYTTQLRFVNLGYSPPRPPDMIRNKKQVSDPHITGPLDPQYSS